MTQYQLTGKYTCSSGVNLENPKFYIKNVNYDWQYNTANLSIIIFDDINQCQDWFPFDVPGEWTSANVLTELLALPQFIDATIIE